MIIHLDCRQLVKISIALLKNNWGLYENIGDLTYSTTFFNRVNGPGRKKTTIYKYKEYEAIDLGALEIKGQIMAPGDLTVNERERQSFKRSLLEKNNFDFENRREIENLR